MLAPNKAKQMAQRNLDNGSEGQVTGMPARAGNRDGDPHLSNTQEKGGTDADGFNVPSGTPILIIASVPADSPWVGESVELPTATLADQHYDTGAVITGHGVDARQLRDQLFESGTLVSLKRSEVSDGQVVVRMEFLCGRHPEREVAKKCCEVAKGILTGNSMSISREKNNFNKAELSSIYDDGEQVAVRLQMEDSGSKCSGDHTPRLEGSSLLLK